MATDPEARSSGSSAVIIAVVALILIVGLAFVVMNRGAETTGDTTVVNNPPATVVNPPATVVNPPDVNVKVPDVTVAPSTGKSGSTGSADSGGGS
jgi:hypothetical protein